MGGHFCNLDQTHSQCESASVKIMSFRPRNRLKTKNKDLHQKLKSFCPRNQVKTYKEGFHRNLRLNSAEICGIYSCCHALFRLLNQRSNLDGGTLNLNGGNANSSWGDASPYNLSFKQDATSDGSIYG